MHSIFLPVSNTYPTIKLLTDICDVQWVNGSEYDIEDIAVLDFEFTPDGDTVLPLPDYVSPAVGIPLFSDRLRRVLESSGVNNIQYFNAVVRNAASNESYNYYAANVVGLVSCVDREQSAYIPSFGSDFLIGGFQRLVIDESKIKYEGLFRLAEYSLIALVSEDVKTAIMQAELGGILFASPEEWNGLSTTT